MKTLILFLFPFAMASATPSVPASPFPTELFLHIAKDAASKNVIFSPASIQTCLAMIYLGAEGETAQELKTGLQLSGEDKQEVVQHFSKIFDKTKSSEKASLKIANRIYVNQKFHLSSTFNDLGAKYFHAKGENVNFSQSTEAAKKINDWVEAQTANKITNLVDAGSLNDDTASVVVNAVYFKAEWVNTFDSYGTHTGDFAVSGAKKVQVQMMSQEDKFLYGELKELDALALQMDYMDTDISMLVLLPKKIDGLAALEQKLKGVDLTKLSSQMRSEKVNVHMPKFKIEFDISLVPILKKLGIKRVFDKGADLSALLETPESMHVSEVKHKAFIEVNEAGTEAAAATYATIQLDSLLFDEQIYNFKADHPFFFALKDSENVYFAGHVVEL